MLMSEGDETMDKSATEIYLIKLTWYNAFPIYKIVFRLIIAGYFDV